MHEYLSWPAEGLDPYRLAAQTQVIRVVAMVAAKAGMRQADDEAAERWRQEFRRYWIRFQLTPCLAFVDATLRCGALLEGAVINVNTGPRGVQSESVPSDLHPLGPPRSQG
jgi:hypothetical protein